MYVWQYERNRRDGAFVYEDGKHVDKVAKDMPYGWYVRFVKCGGMLEIIQDVLERCNLVEYFRIDQIKEKWGQLEFYYHFAIDSHDYFPHETQKAVDELDSIFKLYGIMSRQVCIVCGKNEAMMEDVNGWDSPYCNEHTRGERY